MSKMTKAEKIEKIVEGLEARTDFDILKEMKGVLNSVFGEANTQIVKPNLETMKDIARGDGNLTYLLQAARDLDPEPLENWLKGYNPDTLCYQILIKFPEVKITNGEDDHIIRDLYVRAFVRPNGTMIPHLDGIRGKLSIAEVRSGYAHSHLPYINAADLYFNQFCTGIGPINQVLMLLNNKFSLINFKMFMFHLKVFVAWESKEGRPHMYLENISKANQQTQYYLHDSHAANVGDVILRRFRTLDKEFALGMLTYDVLPTRIEVKINDEFEKWASDEIRGWDLNHVFPGYGFEMDSLLNTKDNNGRYYPIPRRGLPPDQYDSNRVLFHFKGEEIKLQVELEPINDQETIKDEEKVPHQSITKYVSKKLSSNLSKSAFGNARIRLCSAGAY